MKKLMILPLITFMISTAQAQKAQLLVIDPDIDSSELEENFNVQRGSTFKSSIPEKSDRDAVLKAVPKTQEWDELEKDIFYMDLGRKSVEELKKQYPSLSLKEIKILKDRR